PLTFPTTQSKEDFRKIIQRDKLNRNKDRLLNGGERT
ncbi:TPA: nucleoside triphosphate hydrolase, partial [Streptococcus equi subsp. equi]|nr:nucleoside triphosphate hydrolase [Streptococcus equi subsp. equi]